MLCAFPAPAEDKPPVALTRHLLQGHSVQVVRINLNSDRIVIRPIVARAGPREASELVGKPAPLAAVTGTFFDTATSLVIGSIASQGHLLEEGTIGNTLAINRRHQASLLATAGRMGRYLDWSSFDFAISSGPTLVRCGKLAVNPQTEGFRDPGLFGPRRRTAIGVTAGNKLLLVGVQDPVSIHTLARIMRELGSVHAVNMDGGTSAALYYHGRLLLEPKRRLTNMVGVYLRGHQPALPKSLASRALQHFQRGLERIAQHRLREARSQLCSAVAISPEQARYHSALAEAERDMGDRPGAAEQYLRAAMLYLSQGRAQQALALARLGAKLDERRADLQLVMGRAAYEAGQIGLARSALQAVLSRYPGHPEAEALLRRIDWRPPSGRFAARQQLTIHS